MYLSRHCSPIKKVEYPHAHPFTCRARGSSGRATISGLALSACSAGASDDASGSALSVVGFWVLEAANKPVFEDFEGTDAGKGVTFKTSYGASGDQSRAVDGGLDADNVHFSLEPDMTAPGRRRPRRRRLERRRDHGHRAPPRSSCFVVREGNPKGIQGGTTSSSPASRSSPPTPPRRVRPGGTSSAACGHVIEAGGSEQDATEYVAKFLGNAVALPG